MRVSSPAGATTAKYERASAGGIRLEDADTQLTEDGVQGIATVLIRRDIALESTWFEHSAAVGHQFFVRH